MDFDEREIRFFHNGNLILTHLMEDHVQTLWACTSFHTTGWSVKLNGSAS